MKFAIKIFGSIVSLKETPVLYIFEIISENFAISDFSLTDLVLIEGFPLLKAFMRGPLLSAPHD